MLTLSNGVTVKVTTVSSGAVTAATVQSLGTASVSATGLTTVSTTGAGTGAVFSLTLANQIALTSLYTGSLGNQAKVTLGTGSSSTVANPTYKLIVAMPGVQEVFDNIGGIGAALWTNMANAVNNGVSAIRGPSALILATAGTAAATPAPAPATFALAGGTDGAATITASLLVGQDTLPRKGMYALRTLGCSVAWLADADDNTEWANQVAFATSEFVYMIGTGPAGDTITNALSVKQAAGVDSPWFKLMFGDWIYWQDSTNNVLRLVSPQGFIGGLLGNLAPQNSTLNQPLFGVVGTQKTGSSSASNGAYAYAELQQLIGGRPRSDRQSVSGRVVFRRAIGSQQLVRCDAEHRRLYPHDRLHLDVAGRSLRRLRRSAADGAAAAQRQGRDQRLLPVAAGCRADRHLDGHDGLQGYAGFDQQSGRRVALGYEQADVQVTYLNVVEKFLVNFQGGGSVQIASNQTDHSHLPVLQECAMPVNVGQPNSYNLGRDCTFTIVGPTGIVSFPITEGSAKQETKQVQSRPLNGPPIFAEIPDGWSGQLQLRSDRAAAGRSLRPARGVLLEFRFACILLGAADDREPGRHHRPIPVQGARLQIRECRRLQG
ncbi:MAG: hypothetical protein WDN69_10135 [Aliidongia sp.]